MEKDFRQQLISDNINNVKLYAEFSIEKFPNISENWIVRISYKNLLTTEEIDKVTSRWIYNPYDIINEVEGKDIEFLALARNVRDGDGNIIGERMCHRVKIRRKKDVFAHRYLLNELSTNANIDITNQQVNYTKEKKFCNTIDTTRTHEI